MDDRRSGTSSGRQSSRAGGRWSESDDAVILSGYPNYAFIRGRLPRRSFAALKHRAADLGVVSRRHVWTNVGVAKLTDLIVAGASNRELAAAFPNLRLSQITGKARHLRLPRRKARLARFEDGTLSKVRQRAIDVGMSLRRLDEAAGTGRYFQKSTRRIVLVHVARAVAVLGGEILIKWDD